MQRHADLGALVPVAARALLALVAVGTFLLARPLLDPGALAAARFGLGIVLFALLVDLGRSFAGTGRPIEGSIGSHRQQASPQVDEAYQHLRSAVQAYVDEGRIEAPLQEGIEQAAGAQGVPGALREELTRTLEQARPDPEGEGSLLAVRLLSGGTLALGLGLTAAALAEALAMAVVPPVLLVTGTSVATLQWRTRASGARWVGLLLGLAGVGLFALGALQILAASTPAGLLLLAVAALAAMATLAASLRATKASTGQTHEDLRSTLERLRRAFFITLLAGLAMFALEPVLTAIAPPAREGLEVAALLLATVMTFLAIEGAGTWLYQAHRRRRGDREREERREAIDTVLDELDQAGARTPEEAAS